MTTELQNKVLACSPKFRIGDRARVSQGLGKYEIVTILYHNADDNSYRVEFDDENAIGCLWYAESSLEPYIEPETKDNTRLNGWDEDFKKMDECFEKMKKTVKSLYGTLEEMKVEVNKLKRL